MWNKSSAIICWANNTNERSRHLITLTQEVVKSLSVYDESVFYFSFLPGVYQ
jgi:hypothetical protein